MLSGFRDGIYVSQAEVNLEKAWETVGKALDNAVDSMIEMKEREGRVLCGDLMARIGFINKCIAELKSRAPLALADYKNRLSERIKDLTGGMDVDESRLIQEIAIMAEKSDITEEIVRFKSHVEQFEGFLKEDGAVGRKMDFLLQEMHREVNTIGSKSSDLEMARNVIEVKTELAKLREQVQNIE
jgi:uncharacterized protein (TIGR00255 family)